MLYTTWKTICLTLLMVQVDVNLLAKNRAEKNELLILLIKGIDPNPRDCCMALATDYTAMTLKVCVLVHQ